MLLRFLCIRITSNISQVLPLGSHGSLTAFACGHILRVFVLLPVLIVIMERSFLNTRRSDELGFDLRLLDLQLGSDVICE